MMEFTFEGIVRQGFGFHNPNHAAAFICSILPFLWGWRKYAWLGWSLSGVLAIMLALTYSRTGFLVLAGEITLYFILAREKKWYKIAVTAVCVLLIFAVVGVFRRFCLDAAVSNRPLIWFAGLQLYAENPFGAGVGNSGTMVSNFILQDIRCRTLVNSHLTLLAEQGIFAGWLWCTGIGYALLQGLRRIRSWCAVVGLCASAFCASIFDWHLLAGCNGFESLSSMNLILSWVMFIWFLMLLAWMAWGKMRLNYLLIAMLVSGCCVTLPLLLSAPNCPKVKGGAVCRGNNSPLILYGDEWEIRTVLPFCGPSFRLPLQAGIMECEAEEVMLFGTAAEYAHLFPKSKITYVYPPVFFEPASNMFKVILPIHDEREFYCPVERK